MRDVSVRRPVLAVAMCLTVGALAGGWQPAAAQWLPTRPDSHAPIGVMADHLHEMGEVMLSYRFMAMGMSGVRVGTESVPDTLVVTETPNGLGFTVTPLRMSMQMHMFGIMWAPTNSVTLMAMIPFEQRSMDHLTRARAEFTTESSGMGDIRAGALVSMAEGLTQNFHAQLMLGLPSGSVTAQDELPNSGNPVQLPYPMQIGSGTLSLNPGVTWLGQAGPVSWGLQAQGLIRLNRNVRSWTRGDEVAGTFWAARMLSINTSISARVEGRSWTDIRGMDAALDPEAVPTANPKATGGSHLFAGAGINFYLPNLKGLRVAAEGMIPVYQDLHGPQLEADWRFTLGVQLVPVSGSE